MPNAFDSTKFLAKSKYYTKADGLTDVNWTDTRDQEATTRTKFAVVEALTATIATGKFIALVPANRKDGIKALKLVTSAGGASAAVKLVAVDQFGTKLADISSAPYNVASAVINTEDFQTSLVLYKALPQQTAHLALEVTGGTLPVGWTATLSADIVVQ